MVYKVLSLSERQGDDTEGFPNPICATLSRLAPPGFPKASSGQDENPLNPDCC